MASIRRDVYALGAPWDPTIEWYARAITAMQARAPSDRTSWAYLAAVHGEDLPGWQGVGVIPAGAPVPSQAEVDRVWNQCQHGSWYFLPWHRGYLHAFEAIVARTISDLGGPQDWALPYWNYLDTANPSSRSVPQAFTDPVMPDGSPNPLSLPFRAAATLGPTAFIPRDITLGAMNERFYTAAPGALGFGGGITAFAHGGAFTGAMEFDPHNLVHVMLGGLGASAGFMSDPNYAALDPIFWLHHCNIDRLWAAWMAKGGVGLETRPQWMNGPIPQQFEMPDEAGNLFVFTPSQTVSGGILEPSYDTLSSGTGVTVIGAGAMPAGVSSPPPQATPIGANDQVVNVVTDATTMLQLEPMAAEPAGLAQERLFLNLEGIKGAAPSGVLNVFIGLPPETTVPAATPEFVDTVPLFGLANASAEDRGHAGNGLTMVIEVTGLVRQLLAADGDLSRLQIRLEQPGNGENGSISVERISLYRQING